MKNIMIKSFLVLNLTAVSALMVACAGDSSDPIADKYPDLKVVEEHNEVSDKQIGFRVNPFIIEIEGGSTNNYGEFIEGKSGTAQIRITPNNLPGKDDIKLAGLPKVNNFPATEQYTLTQSKTDANVFVFEWKPSTGFTQGRPSRNITFGVTAETSDRQSKKASLLSFTVTKSGEIPSIIESNGIENITATEGSTVKFQIAIRDPNYQGGGFPELLTSAYENTDRAAFKANASNKIDTDYDSKTRHEGGGVFRFYKVMKLSDITEFRNRRNEIDPNANSVDMCFLARAKSVTGVESTPRPYCFTVNYLAQEGKLTWDSQEPIVVPAGEEKSFGFKISTQNGFSDVRLTAVRDPIVGLSGTKSIEKVSGDNTKEVSYVLKWKPACGARNIKKYPIKLEITSSLNGKTRKTPVSFEVEAIDSETNCAPKAAPQKGK